MKGHGFFKGHGTGNDFVILPDPHAELDLSDELVQRICDRRFGIGADGILRVIPVAASDSGLPTGSAQWFMDYRNADGSIASMCGNGARVFAWFLYAQGLEAQQQFEIATRAGRHLVTIEGTGHVRIGMGHSVDGPDGSTPTVAMDFGDGHRVDFGEADAWWMPNPHAVVFVDDVDSLPRTLPAPVVNDGGRFPDGQNVEFVQDTSDGGSLSARMRVHERGVGETQSCGTGVCAAALSLRARHSVLAPGITQIDVPGGRLQTEHYDDGTIDLIGPAVLVASGSFDPQWWEETA